MTIVTYLIDVMKLLPFMYCSAILGQSSVPIDSEALNAKVTGEASVLIDGVAKTLRTMYQYSGRISSDLRPGFFTHDEGWNN